MTEPKKYNLVISNSLENLINTTNEAIEHGCYPKGGMQHVNDKFIQAIYLRDPETKQKYGVWQLCPKCNGEGTQAPEFGQPNSTPVTVQCGVCQGAKVLMSPIQE